MKYFFFLISFLLSLSLAAQNKNPQAGNFDKNKKVQTVEAGCGECKLGLKGKSCDLAIRIDGKDYFVDGIHIDSLGDAHAEEGFCNSIRIAEVQGQIKNDRFVANYFELVASPAKKD